MNKGLLIVFFFLSTIFSYGKVVLFDTTYYDSEDLKKFDITISNDNILNYNTDSVLLKRDSITFNGYSLPFLNPTLEKDGKTYYNSYIVDTLISNLSNDPKGVKILSLAPSVTEKIIYLGLKKEIVGRTAYSDYIKEASDIPSIGTMYNPSIEKIITLSPNIIIGESHYNKKSLEPLDIKKVFFGTPTTFNELFDNIKELSETLGVEKRGSFLIGSMKTTISYYNNLSKGMTRITGTYIVYGGRELYLPPKNSYIDEYLDLLNIENISPQKKGWNVSYEKFILSDPKILLYDKNHPPRALLNTKVYRNIYSIKYKQVVPIKGEYISVPGVDGILNGLPIIYEKVKPYLKEKE